MTDASFPSASLGEYKTAARRRAFAYAVITAAALLLVAVFLFRNVGRWLVREDPLSPADVIVVLSGSMPYRAEEAAQLFRKDLAREIWITRPSGPGADLAVLGIPYHGEEEYNFEVLQRNGVPATAIRVLPETIVDTEEEMQEISRELRDSGKTSAIIVTSPPHTRRVKTLWRKLAADGVRAEVRAAPQDAFDADHWWRTTHDAFAVARELLGLVNAWMGLPIRPQPS
jgi:uncharacterized SAM-binding protein YcdF (DUF218 family)